MAAPQFLCEFGSFKLIGALGLSPTGDLVLAKRMLRSSGDLLPTGVARFDRLALETPEYAKWAANVERRGYKIRQLELPRGTAAEIDGKALNIDPTQFRYVDLLHESRHIAQLERSGKSSVGLSRNWLGFFEEGAYRYELRMGEQAGFSDAYKAWALDRIGDYTTRGMRLRFQMSSQFNGVWR